MNINHLFIFEYYYSQNTDSQLNRIYSEVKPLVSCKNQAVSVAVRFFLKLLYG